MNLPYPPATLEALISDLESELDGRKESLKGDNPTRIRQAVCAFDNDLADHRRPGLLFVGVRDDGTPTGFDITDELLLQLSDIKTDRNNVAPPTLSVDKHILLGKAVAVVTVQPSDFPPVRFRGQTWIRVDPSRSIASIQDERVLNEKRRPRDSHFHAQPVSTASLNDLDRSVQTFFHSRASATAVQRSGAGWTIGKNGAITGANPPSTSRLAICNP